jgi:Cu(I)/Ag(I) efflux system protein CusF
MNTVKPLFVALAIAASASLSISAHAQAMDHSKMGGMNMPGTKMDAMAAPMSEGEVRKIDKEAKKITLKHGDIKNLDMPGMTMVFQVKDVALLDKVKAGDKVTFTAEKATDGAIVVTAIEPAK